MLATRFWIAFLVMSLLLLTRKVSVSFAGKPKGELLLLALLQPVLYFYCESFGILHTNATFAGVIIALSPIASIALGALFLREYPTRIQKVFSVLPIVGVILITLSGSSMGIIKPLGFLLLVGTCMSAAAYRIVSRKAADHYTAFERTYAMMAMGAVVFGADTLIQNRQDLAALVTPFTSVYFVAAVIFLGVLCSVVGFMCVNFSMACLPVAKASVFASLTTVVSIFAGVLLLSEPIAPISVVGSVLIIVGIWKVSAEPESKTSPNQQELIPNALPSEAEAPLTEAACMPIDTPEPETIQ